MLAMGLVYGGLCQFISGILEWIKGNGFTGLAFASYGSFWIAFDMIFAIPVWGWGAPADYKAVSCFLLVWTIFTVILFLCTFNKSICDMLVFGILALHLLIATIGNWSESKNTVKAAGYIGCLCAAVAIYTASAILINDNYKRIILPLGITGKKIGEPMKKKGN